jgi:hypothetical protein
VLDSKPLCKFWPKIPPMSVPAIIQVDNICMSMRERGREGGRGTRTVQRRERVRSDEKETR